MAWRNGRSSITRGALGQVVQTSVRNSLGRVSPAWRERAGLNDPWDLFQPLFSAFSGKLVEGKVRPSYIIGGLPLTSSRSPQELESQEGSARAVRGLSSTSETCRSQLPCGHSQQLRMSCFLSENNSVPCHWSVHKGLEMSHYRRFHFLASFAIWGTCKAEQMIQKQWTL